ncbi:MAG: hypothetical protein CVU59_01880 [Deltaproteobacteria bacterium HGW-Deltaproteobacteria-17]|nr:MAG: hypothetical protein CVU59_01880 [Deltaproteobacteria bacterium HGW-Deltaproteobacteria-17]
MRPFTHTDSAAPVDAGHDRFRFFFRDFPAESCGGHGIMIDSVLSGLFGAVDWQGFSWVNPAEEIFVDLCMAAQYNFCHWRPP